MNMQTYTKRLCVIDERIKCTRRRIADYERLVLFPQGHSPITILAVLDSLRFTLDALEHLRGLVTRAQAAAMVENRLYWLPNIMPRP